MKQRTSTRTNQQGAASIEFAFMFVLVFMLFYGMIGYFAPLLLAASYQEIAGEAAREAILHNYDDRGIQWRSQLASDVVSSSWLPVAWANGCADYPSGQYYKETSAVLSTCIRHAEPSSIIPQISLFGWRFPVLPAEIKGEAIILRQSKEGNAP